MIVSRLAAVAQLGDLDQMANSGGTCSTAAVPIVRPSQMSVGVTTFGIEVLQLLASRTMNVEYCSWESD
jgi:hypothetical protein